MNNAPDCDDFDNDKSYLNQVDDYTGAATGAQCTDNTGTGCGPTDAPPATLQWNDDGDSAMTSCTLGNGAAIKPNNSGSFDLVDSTGTVQGNCVIPSDAQDVDCPTDPVDFDGVAIFQCTSSCTAINSN